jgi:hypothetical protein
MGHWSAPTPLRFFTFSTWYLQGRCPRRSSACHPLHGAMLVSYSWVAWRFVDICGVYLSGRGLGKYNLPWQLLSGQIGRFSDTASQYQQVEGLLLSKMRTVSDFTVSVSWRIREMATLKQGVIVHSSFGARVDHYLRETSCCSRVGYLLISEPSPDSISYPTVVYYPSTCLVSLDPWVLHHARLGYSLRTPGNLAARECPR